MQLADIQADVAKLKFDRSKWSKVSIGAIVRSVKVDADPEASGLERFIAGEHMTSGSLRITTWGKIGDGYLGPAFHRYFKPGQVLFGSRRPYLRKVARVDFEGICANTTLVLEPMDERVSPELLPFIISSPSFLDHAIKMMRGSVNPYVNWSDLVHHELLLPTPSDQNRIADLLWAIEGVLTLRQDSILACVQLRTAQIGEFAREFASGHDLSPLDKAIKAGRPITYGILKPGTGYPNGVPVIKVRDYPAGFIDTSSLLLTDPRIDEEYRRSRLLAGDLLISIRGTVGRIAEVPPSLAGANITQDTARLSIDPAHDRTYIRCLLESEFVQSQLRHRITGLAVQGINIGELRKIQIPLPELNIQKSIVARQEAIELSLNQLNENLSAIATLKQALMAQTFGDSM